VNLEAEVRKATQAALEAGPKPDTFSLAQAKIELLMSQGPYANFLQSPIYLGLLKSHAEDAKSSQSA
uniref:RGS domain-containing protein n=1 Tax=Steinernema glaseri TaxID=37863 RepID=A0A1I7YR33_9BILA